MGWLADYFMPDGKSHMRSIPDKFPIDVERWEAVLRGTGEEMQCWTVGRDVGRAVVELCRAEKWVSLCRWVGWLALGRGVFLSFEPLFCILFQIYGGSR